MFVLSSRESGQLKYRIEQSDTESIQDDIKKSLQAVIKNVGTMTVLLVNYVSDGKEYKVEFKEE